MAHGFEQPQFGGVSNRLTVALRQSKPLVPVVPIGIYRTGDRCRNCDGSNWLVGRSTVECAHCGHALPKEQAGDA